jgi:hypothetical protein
LSIENLLSRLQKVRRTGPNRWLACCPAHDDRNPSMNVKLGDDGTILVVCRAGCDNNSIREAVGMEWIEFFPEKSTGIYDRKLERAFPASDILKALDGEALIVAVAACNVANGIELTQDDKNRLLEASARISAAREMALGER